MYNNLDLNEFFKDEYSKVNYSEGIGGVGIITENQIVKLYNDYKLCKQDNKYYLGLGDHIVKFEELLKNYYKEIFDKYRITIGAYTFGSNVRENGPEVECYSNLEPIYEYISKRVNKSLTRKLNDKKIIIYYF